VRIVLRSERSRDVSGFQVAENCRRCTIGRRSVPAAAACREFQHASFGTTKRVVFGTS